MKLDLNMLFWSDNHPEKQRERNARFSYTKLKELSQFLSQYLEVTCNLYDYTPVKLLEDAIHIPYPNNIYKRSEKINNLLKNSNSDLFAILDSDCFFDKSSYQNLANIILNEKTFDTCFTFDLCDLGGEDSKRIIYENVDPGTVEYSRRYPGRVSTLAGLGHFFIIGNNVLKKHGGFNEKFIYWGGEDGEIYDKINRDSSIKKIVTHIEQVKIYHLSHITIREDGNYFNNDYYLEHQQR